MSTLESPSVSVQERLGDPLDRARSLGDLIRAEADTTQEIGQISEKVIEAFRETELFWIDIPAELGGEDIPMKKRFEVYEEVARHDGSTGWSFMTLSGFAGYSSVGLGDDAVREMYVDGESRATAAGFAAPGGIATPVEGGYRLTGKYRFGSGVLHASYFAAGGFVDGTNMTEVVTAIVPREQATVTGGWDVIGLQGSGSVDFEVNDVFVPSQYVFSPAAYVPLRGGAGGRMDFVGTAVTYHSAVACGIAKRALEDIVAVADQGKQRPPHLPVIDQQIFLHDFAYKEAQLAAARALMIENIENARSKIESGEGMDDFDRSRLRQTANLIHNVVREVVEFAYYWGGTNSVRQGSTLGRAMLDIHVAQQHALVDHNNVVEVAPFIIDHYRTV
ncbi:MAG: hypothetical protein JWQ19_1252 [Subtercola sp.]|nr:hypothetical protein [Subtercola sp.]